MENENEMMPEQASTPAASSTFSALHQSLDRVRAELEKNIKGQEGLIRHLMVALLSKGHVLIEGVPGVAKTLTAKSLAKTLDAAYSRIQFTPDLMPSDILGTNIFNVKESKFELKRGPIHANIVLIDEVNRAPAKTQAALFEVMEEQQVTIDGETLTMDEPFLVLATQNPIEQEGTYRLPEAQLDRFLIKVVVDYPDETSELAVLNMHQQATGRNLIDQLQVVLKKSDLLQHISQVQQVKASEANLKYIADIIRGSRSFNGIYLGASPRGAIALLRCAKGLAAMEGRDFITPDDIKEMVNPVLRHRIILTPEKEMEGKTPDEVLLSLIKQIEVPR